jgi:hypothetical protein
MNSSIEIAEATKLAQKLIDRTVEGKLVWESVEVGSNSVADAPSFVTRLEQGLKATVRLQNEENLDFSLVEFDPRQDGQLEFIRSILGDEKPLRPDKVVLSVSVDKDPPYGFGTPQEKFLAGRLVDLFGVARRSALKIDSSVERALSYLDRIAG